MAKLLMKILLQALAAGGVGVIAGIFSALDSSVSEAIGPRPGVNTDAYMAIIEGDFDLNVT